MMRLRHLVLALAVLSTAAAGCNLRSGPTTEQHEDSLDPAALEALRTVFAAAESARIRLANDALEGLDEDAARMISALQAAAEAQAEGPHRVRAWIEAATEEARKLGEAPQVGTAYGQDAGLHEARQRFGNLSGFLVALAEHEPRLTEGYAIFRCPMVEHFPKWFQAQGDMENPYMGQAMLACGTADHWATDGLVEAHEHPDDEVAYWTCPMHPSIRDGDFGPCPICGMDLVAVTHGELRTGAVVVDSLRRQRFGVRTEALEPAPLVVEVRALGRVVVDERRVRDVNPRVQGWVERLHVNETGRRVRRGEPLLRLYSPELLAAQRELLIARRSASPGLLDEATTRLRLAGMADDEIQAVLQAGEPRQTVVLRAPSSGFVIEKSVVEGDEVGPGRRLFRIADLEAVWVEADVFEADVPFLREGAEATVEVPHLRTTLPGTVSFRSPVVDPRTRTVAIRVELDNPELALLPGMFADVVLRIEAEERLTVPQDAVIYTGSRRVVFVDHGDGQLVPRDIRVGRLGDGRFEVLEGLKPGDVVVSSGVFLVAAESRLRSAATYWGSDEAR